MLITRDGYEIDDDPARLDVDAIHAFLSRDAYWSPGIPRGVVSRAIRPRSCTRPEISGGLGLEGLGRGDAGGEAGRDGSEGGHREQGAQDGRDQPRYRRGGL
jgi:hypothetical protein